MTAYTPIVRYIYLLIEDFEKSPSHVIVRITPIEVALIQDPLYIYSTRHSVTMIRKRVLFCFNFGCFFFIMALPHTYEKKWNNLKMRRKKINQRKNFISFFLSIVLDFIHKQTTYIKSLNITIKFSITNIVQILGCSNHHTGSDCWWKFITLFKDLL